MPKRTSSAGRQLSAELERRGHAIQPRSLENWTAEGLLASSPPRGLGYPGGSVSTMPPGAVDRAIRAEALLDRYRLFPRAVLAMFAEGSYDVPHDKVERSFRTLLARGARFFTDEPNGLAQHVQTAAMRLARQAGKRADFSVVRERLKRPAGARDIYASERIRRYFSEVSLVLLTGETSSEQGLDQLIFGLGIADATAEQTINRISLGGRVPRHALRSALRDTSIGAFESLIKSVRSDELLRARDDAALLVKFSRAFSSVAWRVHRLPHAFGFSALGQFDSYGTALLTLALLAVRKALPDQLDAFVKVIADHRARFEARAHLLDHVEPRFHPAFQDKATIEALPRSDLDALRGHLDSYRSRFPLNFELACELD